MADMPQDRRELQRRVTDGQSVAPAWIFQAFDDLRRDFQESHQRLRDDFRAFTDEIRLDQRAQDRRTEEVDRKIDIVVAERASEEKSSRRNTTFIAMVASSGIALIVEAFKRIFGVHP